MHSNSPATPDRISHPPPKLVTKRYAILCAVGWTILLGCSLVADFVQHDEEIRLIGINTARSLFEKDILMRRWGAHHGGVYVPVTDRTQPNPYLAGLPERDITTPSGRQLTLMNPAYMTRQVFEMEQAGSNGYRGHITSLTPIRPENAPDPWERKALESFTSGIREVSVITQEKGQPVIRLMKPLMTEKPCLKCHAFQGYHEGDIRGGISVTLPLAPIQKPIQDEMRIVIAAHLGVWLLGLTAIGFGYRRIHRMSTALINERNSFRVMFDAAPVGMVLLDESVSAVAVNGAFAHIVERDVSDIIGKRYGEVLGCRNALLHPEGCGVSPECPQCPIITALREALTTAAPTYCAEAHLLTTCNGQTVMKWVLFSVEVFQLQDRRHALMSLDDITERKQAEVSMQEAAELQKAHIRAMEQAQAIQKEAVEKLSIVANGIPSLIAYVDTRQRYLYVNNSYAAWVGMPEDEIIGKTVSEVVPKETYAATIPYINRVLQGHACFFERAVSLNGADKVHYVSLVPQFDGRGDVKAYFALVTDISEQRNLTDQLRHSQKMDAIGQLAGGVAHDFNNILTVITGYCQLMQLKTAEGDPLRADIDQVYNAAERAANLTQSLLSFSRKQTLALQSVNLNPILWNMEKFLKRIIGEDIRLSVTLPEEALTVSADGGQLQQVMMNLATNARDAMPSGGTFSMTLERHEFDEAFVNTHGFGTPGRYALLTVSDTGRGMDGATRERLFEPFFTTKEVGKGTGLGLSIVYGIIKQHNGYITVDSEPGEGTTIRIFLPLHTRMEATPASETARHSPQRGKETILVVEDDDAVRGVVETTLRNFEYDVLLAADGLQAVEIFAEHRQRVDLVLMDIIMPNLNGREAAQRIRLIQPHVRILFTSGYTADIINIRGDLDSGEELLMKPVKPLDLLRKTREMLDRQQPQLTQEFTPV